LIWQDRRKTRKDFVKTHLGQKGYTVNSDALDIINTCELWYGNKDIENFHERKNLNGAEVKLHKLNFAKRCCADDANLCEIISVVPEKESKSVKFIEEIINKNRFITQFRKQLEKVSATGTVGAYISLKNAKYMQAEDETISVKGGTIKINYVDADCILPLTVENDVVVECAFAATNKVRGKEKTTLVEFLLEDDKYKAITTVFDDKGNKLDDECITLQLGEVKPFSVMTNAEVNNIEELDGYGLPKVYNSIPLFMAVDLCYNLLYGDLAKGDKLVFLNELLACIKKNEKTGKVELTPQQKEIFVLLGDEAGKLPTEKSLVQEYNPEIRIDAITKAFELVLSLLSISFGYGSKKYTFENGQIKTATEYIGTKQDAMQELNKQRANATDYITDIIHAAMWFANTFHGANHSLEEELSIQFDDSYVEDKVSKLESMRADALSFGEVTILKVWYLMEKYNLSEEDAKKYINYEEEPVDDVED
jgi:A118 family predicted phage portal protein